MASLEYANEKAAVSDSVFTHCQLAIFNPGFAVLYHTIIEVSTWKAEGDCDRDHSHCNY